MAQEIIKEALQEDWYEILELQPKATKEMIEKAARKLFLKYHPDKTSDPDAPAKFLQIQKAKEILLDESKRKEIDEHRDKVIKRKEYESNRSKNMDQTRKRMRDELESRLNSATRKSNEVTAEERDKLEKALKSKKLDELRGKNVSLMEKTAQDNQTKLNEKEKELSDLRKTMAEFSDGNCTQIKVKWRKSALNYSLIHLETIFSKFGIVEDVSFTGNKNSSALITFTDKQSANKAVEEYMLSDELRVSLFVHTSSTYMDPTVQSIFSNISSSIAGNINNSVRNNNVNSVSQDQSIPKFNEIIFKLGKISSDSLQSKENDILKKMMEMKQKKIS